MLNILIKFSLFIFILRIPLATAQCLPGYQATITNSCLPCPTNTFNIDQDTCQNCTAHNCATCDPTNGDCLTCLAGTQLQSNNQCQICAVNTYAPTDGSNVCQDCSGCSICNAITGVCSSCLAGYELLSTGCTTCQTDTYSLGGAGACIACSKCTNCNSTTGQCTVSMGQSSATVPLLVYLLTIIPLAVLLIVTLTVLLYYCNKLKKGDIVEGREVFDDQTMGNEANQNIEKENIQKENIEKQQVNQNMEQQHISETNIVFHEDVEHFHKKIRRVRRQRDLNINFDH